MDTVFIVCCAVDVGLVALGAVQGNAVQVIVAGVAFGLCLAGLVL